MTVHAALQERRPHIVLRLLLPVRIEQRRGQQRGKVVIEERSTGDVTFGDLRPPCMALRAHVDLPVADARRVALRVAARRIDRPFRTVTLVERNGQSHARVGRRLVLRPRDVCGTRPVTAFASDGKVAPRGRVCAVRRVVLLAHVDRVAIRAHEVPVLLAPGPVQSIAMVDPVVWIEVEPALTARGLRTRIPGDRQRLQTAARKFDQILLQRLDTERVLDVEVRELPVRAVGADDETLVATRERRLHACIRNPRVVELALHGLRARALHRARMLRSLPRGRLCRVACYAGFTADEIGDWNRTDGHDRVFRSQRKVSRHQHGDHCDRGSDQPAATASRVRRT